MVKERVSKMGIHISDYSKWGTMKLNVCNGINHPYLNGLYMLNINPLMFFGGPGMVTTKKRHIALHTLIRDLNH